MTTTAAVEASRVAQRQLCFDEALIDGLSGISVNADIRKWPDPRYLDDPAKFFIEVLAFRPWSKQIEIAEALVTHDRVAVGSSHKIGKSALCASIGLWWYAAKDEARVIQTSRTSRQIDEILWREMRTRWRTAERGLCYHCARLERVTRRQVQCCHTSPLEGDMSVIARSGLRADDLRQIIGFTGKDAEAVAGISSPALLYECDEASGIPQEIFAAIEGNRAGGAKILLLGNPTRNEGEHFDALHTKAYVRFTISAFDTPNVIAGWQVIPGTATRSWVDEKKEEWGEDSPEYLVRVLGKHAMGEEGRTLSLQAIQDAQDAWYDTPAEGRLFVGLDVAGPGAQGDESVWAPRRGKKVISLHVHRGLTEEAHLLQTLAILSEFRLDNEPPPVVVLDSEGDVGHKVATVLRAYADDHPNAFVLVAFKSSQNAVKNPVVYDKLRDDAHANMVKWVRSGGTVPPDSKLATELHAPSWYASRYSAKMKVTPKDELRKRLKRSPDRMDAVILSCWETAAVEEDAPHGSGQTAGSNVYEDLDQGAIAMDPYGGVG